MSSNASLTTEDSIVILGDAYDGVVRACHLAIAKTEQWLDKADAAAWFNVPTYISFAFQTFKEAEDALESADSSLRDFQDACASAEPSVLEAANSRLGDMPERPEINAELRARITQRYEEMETFLTELPGILNQVNKLERSTDTGKDNSEVADQTTATTESRSEFMDTIVQG
jgi:hypothetical protein